MPGSAHFSVELDLSETPEDFLQHPRRPLSLMLNLHRSTAKKNLHNTAANTVSTELGVATSLLGVPREIEFGLGSHLLGLDPALSPGP
jgi:hypothetical protein